MKYIIKPTTGEDFYVEWSTVVDNWTFAGDRDTMLTHVGVTEERLDRADKFGTSALEPRGYLGWGDTSILVREGPGGEAGMLSRERLAEWVYATSEEALEESSGEPTGMLTPFGDEPAVAIGPVGDTGTSAGPHLSTTGEPRRFIVGEPGPELISLDKRLSDGDND